MQISGNHVWQGSAVQFLKRKIQVYQSSLAPMATSKPDQSIKKRFVYFWKEANKVERSGAHSRWSKGQSPSRQESITRILWYWVKLDLNCVLVLCFDRLVFPHTARGHERPFGPFTKGGIPIQSFLWSATNMFTREGFFTCKKILPFTSYKDGNM